MGIEASYPVPNMIGNSREHYNKLAEAKEGIKSTWVR
jgi:hypothetical protein